MLPGIRLPICQTQPSDPLSVMLLERVEDSSSTIISYGDAGATSLRLAVTRAFNTWQVCLERHTIVLNIVAAAGNGLVN